jgi:hypothetical protein
LRRTIENQKQHTADAVAAAIKQSDAVAAAALERSQNEVNRRRGLQKKESSLYFTGVLNHLYLTPQCDHLRAVGRGFADDDKNILKNTTKLFHYKYPQKCNYTVSI